MEGGDSRRYYLLRSRKKSIREDRRLGAVLLARFGDVSPTEITAARISEYKAERLAVTSSRLGAPLSVASINRPLAMLRTVLRVACREWETLGTVRHIKLEPEPQGRLRWLDEAEATRLLAACRAGKHPDLADLVTLALFTGMRQGELLGLTWGRVDRARGVVLLEITKSGKRREVPLNSEADAVLAHRQEGATGSLVFPPRWDGYRRAWRKALEVAKLDGFRFHDLRHTYASWTMQRGASLPALQAILGHATLAMTMRYSHLAPAHLRATVALLDGAMAPPARAQETADSGTTVQTTGEVSRKF
jgi:integrase